jgi:hypothetical protein
LVATKLTAFDKRSCAPTDTSASPAEKFEAIVVKTNSNKVHSSNLVGNGLQAELDILALN